MHEIYTDYLKNLEELHQDVLNAIRDLPQEALDWTPLPGANSINVLVTHIAGAEKFWLGDVVAGEPSGRDREAEFKAKGTDFEQLSSLLESSLAYAGNVFERLDVESLASTRVSPRTNKTITVSWSLGHTLKHTAIHLGHIQIMRDLLDERADKMKG
ncbi:MAG: DinB family protein [Anaerolineales bacterium]